MPIEWGPVIKNIGAGISACMIIYETGRKLYDRRKSRTVERKFNKGMDISGEIKARLRHLISRYYFNRVAIVAYSNGNHSLAGESFEFLSITHEETDGTVAALIHQYQRYPSSPFAEIMDEVRKAPEGWVMIDNDTCDPILADIQMTAGVEVSYRFKLGKHMQEGVMVASYSHRDSVREIPHIGIVEMKKIAAEIGALKRSKFKRTPLQRIVWWVRNRRG